jgi:Asp-tRNA(Asn)/Glu-tRNA(Gln) amidotransferase A subunit family amidase
MSIPAGFTASGHLPVGVQFVADAFREDKLLRIGKAFEDAVPPQRG